MEQTDRDLLIKMSTMLEANTEMTQKLVRVIYEGNGKPSMLSRTDAIENHIKDCPAKEIGAQVRGIEKKIWYATGAMAILGAGITAVAKKFGWW